MSKQSINLGTAPTGVGGDTPRSAFTKANANFDELYARDAQLGTAANATMTTSQIDLSVGRVLKVADFGIGTQNTPVIASLNERQSGFFSLAVGQTDALGNTPLSYGTLLNCGFPGGTNGSQIYMGISPASYIGFRSGDFATAPFNKIYHTGNTTRAADGTLKAI